MIYLGLNDETKIEKITAYAKANNIQHIIIFSGEIGGQITKNKTVEPSHSFHLDIKAIAAALEMQPLPYTYGGEAPIVIPEKVIEQYGWADCIEYKVFYNLLGRIDSTYMIVINQLHFGRCQSIFVSITEIHMYILTGNSKGAKNGAENMKSRGCILCTPTL